MSERGLSILSDGTMVDRTKNFEFTSRSFTNDFLLMKCFRRLVKDEDISLSRGFLQVQMQNQYSIATHTDGATQGIF